MELVELFKNGEIFQAISTIITGMGIYILKDLKKSVDKAQESVSRLNSSVEVLVERDEHNKERIQLNRELIKKNELEIHSVRNKMHDFGNDLNKLEVLNIKIEDIKQNINNR